LGIRKFEIQPELGRMLIAGYNYKCREEVCILAGMLITLENRIENLFREPKKREPSEYKKELDNYKKK